MNEVLVQQIDERLKELPPDKLAVVYDFVSFLLAREKGERFLREREEALETMLASEAVLRRDWDRPEEDAAWADL
jgi:hypothetical protein